jgi:hypothetical protein
MIHGAPWVKVFIDGGKEISLEYGKFVEILESLGEVQFW